MRERHRERQGSRGRERRRQGETWGERDTEGRDRQGGQRQTGEAETEGEKDAGREPRRITKNQQTEGPGRGKATFRHAESGKGRDRAAGMDAAVSSASGHRVPPDPRPAPPPSQRPLQNPGGPQNLVWVQSLLGLRPESQSGTSWNQI